MSTIRTFINNNKVKLLWIGAAALAAVICLVPLNSKQQPAPEDAADDIVIVSSDVPLADAGNADNEIFVSALVAGEYTGTILEETSDAGLGYVRDTLFIGDSNTAGMLIHSSTTNVTMDNGIGIVSMGISHVETLRCVKFQGMEAVPVPEAVKIMQPRRIVITYGTNDYYLSPEDFAGKYKKALKAIQEAYPYTDIIIGSIFPVTKNCSYYTVTMPIIDKFNLELVKLARETGVRFLNWSEVLIDPITGYANSEYMSGDGVHLSKKGMEQIMAYFRTHSLDSEDKRPKPLKPIPVREPTPPGLLGSGPRTPVPDLVPMEEQILVTVTFIAAEGGLVNGAASFSMQLCPGDTAGPVSAEPLPGYVFTGWSSGSDTFTVPLDALHGQSFVITALFAIIPVPPSEPPSEPPAEPPIEPPVEPPAEADSSALAL
jgi:hypothetical protein